MPTRCEQFPVGRDFHDNCCGRGVLPCNGVSGERFPVPAISIALESGDRGLTKANWGRGQELCSRWQADLKGCSFSDRWLPRGD